VKKILFTIGSINQVTQMHAIASHLSEYDCYFSQFYSDDTIINWAVSRGLTDNTILGGQFRKRCDEYLAFHKLKNDYRQRVFNNHYDLVVVCSDLLVPKAIRNSKSIWVQEGMTDKITMLSRLVKAFDFPRYLAGNTSLNGTSNLCDIYCVASDGYKNHFKSLGTDVSKLVITGMPNFDNVNELRYNNFPHRNFVLVATSDIRECLGFDNRRAFIRKAVEIANGRPLIFKVHPNEKRERAIREIKENAPEGTLIYTEGNINHMIVQCEELITQYSTVVYVGLALGKKVYSYFDLDDLNQKLPIQNGGRSASHIAEICRNYIEYKGSKKSFIHDQLPSIAAEYQKIAC
jgi:hypothetical protein